MKHRLLTLFAWLHIATAFALAAGADQEVVLETASGKIFGYLLEKEGVDRAATPVVLLIPTHRQGDRDGNILGYGKHNAFKFLSQSLLEQGISTLRVDRRGGGKSIVASMNITNFGFPLLADDAAAWIRSLRERGYREVFVLGHGDGSLLAILAAQKEPTSGVISVQGTGRPAAQLMFDQMIPRADVEVVQEVDQILRQLTAGQLVDNVPKSVAAIFEKPLQPYYISHFAFDPQEEVRRLKNTPILVLHGTHDVQVPVTEGKLLADAAGTPLVTVPLMNFILKGVTNATNMTEQMATYNNPNLPVVGNLVDLIADFVLSHSSSKGATVAATSAQPQTPWIGLGLIALAFGGAVILGLIARANRAAH